MSAGRGERGMKNAWPAGTGRANDPSHGPRAVGRSLIWLRSDLLNTEFNEIAAGHQVYDLFGDPLRTSVGVNSGRAIFWQGLENLLTQVD
jgi:hypothetical protein